MRIIGKLVWRLIYWKSGKPKFFIPEQPLYTGIAITFPLPEKNECLPGALPPFLWLDENLQNRAVQHPLASPLFHHG